MEDELATHLHSLERDDCYRVESVLKVGDYEKTEIVYFVGSNGSEQGPYIRKIISQDAGIGEAYRFLFDAWQTGKRFKHVPLVFDCYTIGSELIVIMEYIRGETLQEVVYRCDPSLVLAQDIFPQVCDAVTELHTSFLQPIIHRDLKPSNIMLTQNGLTLIDFGIARQYKEDAEQDTHHFGTRAYAPPEQFGFGQSDVRSDVYALGMVLYFCLTEKTPSQNMHDELNSRNDIATPLKYIIIKSTSIDPKDRYQTIEELKASFLEAISRLHITSKSPKYFTKTREDEGKRRGQHVEKVNYPGWQLPSTIRIIWNSLVILVFAFFVFVSTLMVVDPLPGQIGYGESLLSRIVDIYGVCILFLGPLFYLALDKRPFRRFVPHLKQFSMKQTLICLLVMLAGFLLIGIV